MTTPPYNPQIPLPSTTVPQAQDLLLNNFRKLFDAFGTNHVALNDPTNPGNHSVVELVEQKNAKTTQSQEIAIYSKKVANQTNQLFMRYQSNGKEFQLTEYQIYSVARTSLQTTYFSFLPGGIVVQFGKLFSAGVNNYKISVELPITKIISGISLSNADVVGVIFPPQSNVLINPPVGGVYKSIGLNCVAPMANQFYLFFGNL